MNNTIKLTEDIKNIFIKHVEESTFKEVVDSTKASADSDTGTFEVVITTETVDRMGEVIKADGWELEYYMKNPVVLWGHDHYGLPVGIATSIDRVDNTLVAKGKFAPTEFGQEVRRLYDLGIVRATSVGFIEKERQGNLITKAELLEFSFVTVPANPMALSTLVKSGISARDMITKGFLSLTDDIVEKAIKEIESETPETPEVPAEETPAEETQPEKKPAEEETPAEVPEKPSEEAETPVETADDGEKSIKISKSKFESLVKALKDATDVLESADAEASDDSEHVVEEEETVDEDGESSPEEKLFKSFKQGREAMQLAVTVLGDALAEARKAKESRSK